MSTDSATAFARAYRRLRASLKEAGVPDDHPSVVGIAERAEQLETYIATGDASVLPTLKRGGS